MIMVNMDAMVTTDNDKNDYSHPKQIAGVLSPQNEWTMAMVILVTIDYEELFHVNSSDEPMRAIPPTLEKCDI